MKYVIALSLIVLAGLAVSGCECVSSPCGDPALEPAQTDTPAPQIDLWGTVQPTPSPTVEYGIVAPFEIVLPSPTPAQGFVAINELREPQEID